MKYRNYLQELANAFNRRFEQISTHYNFEHGNEFEIALCYVLRDILPQKYGICRGFVVPAQGLAAGDDIIIYDSFRFPKLRIFSEETYELRQNIPVEAVYAYIEAKHTLHLNNDINDKQSIVRASFQVSDVKSIPREQREANFLYPYFKADISFERPYWPSNLNPIFGAVIGRQVKKSARSKKALDAQSSHSVLSNSLFSSKMPPPDLIVAGDSNILVPRVITPEGPMMLSPFYVEGVTETLRVIPTKGLAFAIGICMLLYALDTIDLGRMPWEAIINEGLFPPNAE